MCSRHFGQQLLRGQGGQWNAVGGCFGANQQWLRMKLHKAINHSISKYQYCHHWLSYRNICQDLLNHVGALQDTVRIVSL